MLFTVKVVERPEYDRHMAEVRAKGQTGSIETGRITRAGERYWESHRYPEVTP